MVGSACPEDERNVHFAQVAVVALSLFQCSSQEAVYVAILMETMIAGRVFMAKAIIAHFGRPPLSWESKCWYLRNKWYIWKIRTYDKI